MIIVNLEKAKDIAHTMRRAARAEEFKPLDQQININVANPAKLAEVEAERQAVRDKYATVRAEIDAAGDVDALKAIVGSSG